MSILIIGPEDHAKIKVLVADARKNYIPWSVLQLGVLKHDEPVLNLEDRKPGFDRPESQFIELGSYRVAFSFEEQPAGLLRHISVSVPTKGKVPGEPAIAMICEAFGFNGFPPPAGMMWVEEYEKGRYAVNVVEVSEPATKGTMQ